MTSCLMVVIVAADVHAIIASYSLLLLLRCHFHCLVLVFTSIYITFWRTEFEIVPEIYRYRYCFKELSMQMKLTCDGKLEEGRHENKPDSTIPNLQAIPLGILSWLGCKFPTAIGSIFNQLSCRYLISATVSSTVIADAQARIRVDEFLATMFWSLAGKSLISILLLRV